MEEIKQKYPDIFVNGFVCNISKRENVKELQRQIVDKTSSPVDILINNAGIVSGKSLLDLSEQEIRRTMDVNVLAHFWTCQEFLPSMIERNSGMIVSIASTMGFFTAARLSDYCASKHAVVGFHNAIRMEMAKMNANIDFVLICPNAINTGMFKGIKLGFQWLVPILEPKQVSSTTVDAIKKRKVGK